MGSQLLSILKQGIWASLTGGWYYDQKQSHFSNLFHLYLWLLLLCLPLVIELYVKSYVNHFLIWSIYSTIIAALFTVIKSVNVYLHHVFDSGDYTVESEFAGEAFCGNLSGDGTSKSHDEGPKSSSHCYQDEKDNWLTYVFDDNSFSGRAHSLLNSDTNCPSKPYSVDIDTLGSTNRWHPPSSSSSESVVVLDGPTNVIHAPRPVNDQCIDSFSPLEGTSRGSPCLHHPSSINSMFQERCNFSARSSNHRNRFEISSNMVVELNQDSHSNNLANANLGDIPMVPIKYMGFSTVDPQPVKPKQYYKLWIPPCFRWRFVKIRFDRLNLVTLLDPSLTKYELISSIILAVCVAILGSIIIEKGLFTDLWLFLFCFVICSSQYTLLKSVQPDAASPTHGYNRIIIFSRPTYFSIGCSIILLAHFYSDKNFSLSFVLYDFNLLDKSVIKTIEESAKVFVLSFPIIFSFGLLPQINTFCMYLIEQVDIHMFGGTALTIGLKSAFYSLFRSIFVVGLLYTIALTSLYRVTNRHPLLPFTYHDYDVLFSVFCGVLVFSAYFLSRLSSDPIVVHNLFKKYVLCDSSSKKTAVKSSAVGTRNCKNERSKSKPEDKTSLDEDADPLEKHYVDPLPRKLEKTVLSRLENDIIVSIAITVVYFAIHVSKIFTLQPYVHMSLGILAITWGLILHYFFPHFRKELPWLFFSSPILKPREYDRFEVKGEASLMWFEKLHLWLTFVEKNAIYPLVFLSAITKDTPEILNRFGLYLGTLVMVLCALKSIRSTFNDSSHNHLIFLFTYLLFEYDFSFLQEPFLINYAVFTTIYHKFIELLLKIRFVVTYVAPWQISWGSAFHAFAQPFSVPHSGMLFVQAILSSILSSPLQPVLGSAIFLASYVRPIKFWERDYNTKRIDYANARLVNQLERNLIGSDDNNLNSIFYEHLTRSLQHSLAGDLALGRWGQVSQGDCFVLASDNLNCLVHVIELGNGLVTFQVRGLEFRGTYCQQKEVEAINENVDDDEGCCCCEPGHLPSMLSINAAFNQRWLAWEVTHSKYVLEGYSITDNPAASMLQPCELRKALITCYVKSIIYYTIRNSKLESWLKYQGIRETIDNLTHDKDFVDLDPVFMHAFDEDYDMRTSGITRPSFCRAYLSWINYCLSKTTSEKRKDHKFVEEDEKEAVVSLCFALALLARRALSAASYNNCFNSVEFLLYGLHSLFKGDFRITSSRDEWVFQDIDLLKNVIAPAVRMAVKLHTDHFMSTDDYDDDAVLYAAISNYRKNWVISHEADPAWRNALLSNVSSLLALRHVYDDSSNQYKIIMLNIRHLSFRVIKVNRECVRGLWAGQQQELVYLRNNNAERGSIQNAKQALRNIINSSCDQPIGYPIYVSPLITSYTETNTQYISIVGRNLRFKLFKQSILSAWDRIKARCREGCSSGALQDEITTSHIIRTYNTSVRMSSLPCSFNRNQGARCSHESQCSDRLINEYESSLLLARVPKSSCQHASSSSYPTAKMIVNVGSKTNANKQDYFSTLVNVSANQTLEKGESVEMTTFSAKKSRKQTQTIHQSLTLSSTGSVSNSSQLYRRTRAESV